MIKVIHYNIYSWDCAKYLSGLSASLLYIFGVLILANLGVFLFVCFCRNRDFGQQLCFNIGTHYFFLFHSLILFDYNFLSGKVLT